MVRIIPSASHTFATKQNPDTSVNMASFQTRPMPSTTSKTVPPRQIQLKLMERWNKECDRYLAGSSAEQDENEIFVSKMQEAAKHSTHSYGEWMAQESEIANPNYYGPQSDCLDTLNEDEIGILFDPTSKLALEQVKAAREELDALFYSAMQQAAQTNDASYGEYKKRTASFQLPGHEQAEHATESRGSGRSLKPDSSIDGAVQMKPEYGLPEELARAMYLSSYIRASRRKQQFRTLSGVKERQLAWKALADIGHDWPTGHFNDGETQPHGKAARPQRPKGWMKQMQRRARKVLKAQRPRSDGLDDLDSYGFVGGADLTLARALRDQTRKNIAEAATEGTTIDADIELLDLGEPLITAEPKATASHEQCFDIEGTKILMPRSRFSCAELVTAKRYVSRRIPKKRKQGIIEDPECFSPDTAKKRPKLYEKAKLSSAQAMIPTVAVENSEAVLEQEPEPPLRAAEPKPRRTWWNDLRGHWATRSWRDKGMEDRSWTE